MGQDNAASLEFAAFLKDHGSVPVVKVRGELDLQSAPHLWTRLLEASEQAEGSPRVVVDLGEVTFMDSSGLGVLIGHRNELKEADGDLWISVRNGEAAMRVIEVTGLDKTFQISPSVEQAVEEIRDLESSSPPAP